MTTRYNIQKDISPISKMEKKKELTLRLPEDLFAVLKDFKEISGVSYTNQIYTAIVWFYFQKGLLDLNWIKEKHAKNGNNGNEKKELIIDESEADQLNRFCDGDSCEFNPSLMENH